MAHGWVQEVLLDLHRYACANDLRLTARELEAVLRVARAELEGVPAPEADGDDRSSAAARLAIGAS